MSRKESDSRQIHAGFTPNRGRTFKRFTTELVTYYERRTVYIGYY